MHCSDRELKSFHWLRSGVLSRGPNIDSLSIFNMKTLKGSDGLSSGELVLIWIFFKTLRMSSKWSLSCALGVQQFVTAKCWITRKQACKMILHSTQHLHFHSHKGTERVSESLHQFEVQPPGTAPRAQPLLITYSPLNSCHGVAKDQVSTALP